MHHVPVLINVYTSEFAICHVVRHGNVNSIQNPSTLTTPTMTPYCILLPLTLPAVQSDKSGDKSQTQYYFNLGFGFTSYCALYFLCVSTKRRKRAKDDVVVFFVCFFVCLFVCLFVSLSVQTSSFCVKSASGYLDFTFKGVLHPRAVFGLFLHFSQKLQHIGDK